MIFTRKKKKKQDRRRDERRETSSETCTTSLDLQTHTKDQLFVLPWTLERRDFWPFRLRALWFSLDFSDVSFLFRMERRAYIFSKIVSQYLFHKNTQSDAEFMVQILMTVACVKMRARKTERRRQQHHHGQTQIQQPRTYNTTTHKNTMFVYMDKSVHLRVHQRHEFVTLCAQKEFHECLCTCISQYAIFCCVSVCVYFCVGACVSLCMFVCVCLENSKICVHLFICVWVCVCLFTHQMDVYEYVYFRVFELCVRRYAWTTVGYVTCHIQNLFFIFGLLPRLPQAESVLESV